METAPADSPDMFYARKKCSFREVTDVGSCNLQYTNPQRRFDRQDYLLGLDTIDLRASVPSTVPSLEREYMPLYVVVARVSQ